MRIAIPKALIPVVIAVAETHGFAAAAHRLGVSKSAVSKRISAIEQRLGARLFLRSTRNVSLTEAGERFYAHARRAFEAALEAEDSVTALQGAPKGRLKVNVPMAFGRLHAQWQRLQCFSSYFEEQYAVWRQLQVGA